MGSSKTGSTLSCVDRPSCFRSIFVHAKFETEWDAAGIKETLGMKRKPTSPFFKEAGNNSRIYPGYSAPVIVWENGTRQIRPMRYRVRPHGSAEEIPARFNVFNAGLDIKSLHQRLIFSIASTELNRAHRIRIIDRERFFSMKHLLSGENGLFH